MRTAALCNGINNGQLWRKNKTLYIYIYIYFRRTFQVTGTWLIFLSDKEVHRSNKDLPWQRKILQIHPTTWIFSISCHELFFFRKNQQVMDTTWMQMWTYGLFDKEVRNHYNNFITNIPTDTQNNLSTNQRTAMKELSTNTNIVLKEADKGGANSFIIASNCISDCILLLNELRLIKQRHPKSLINMWQRLKTS